MLFFSVILSYNMIAQLEVKEGSFKEVEGFVNINTDIMFDDNDKPYAVLKVKTENINDKERHQLLFQGDARTFFEVEYKVGEVWLYISYYATYIKISHPDFGSTEFWFPFDMHGKKGYELTLINKPSVSEDFQKRLEALENATAMGINTGEYGYVVIKTTPVNGATVLIDGEEMEMKTPFVSDKLGVGHHRIRVIKEHYKPYVVVVQIDDGETINLDVTLEQAFGNLKIVSKPENVDIKLNRIDKGTTPQTFNNIPVGNYKIELDKKKYKTFVQDVAIKDGETTYVDVEMEPEKSLRKKGYVFRTEIGAGFLYNSKQYVFGLDDAGLGAGGYDVVCKDYNDIKYFILVLNTGYQINPFVYMGVGVGIDNKALSMISLPLYLNPRLYMKDTMISWYFDAKIGYAVSLKSSDCYRDDFYNLIQDSNVEFSGLFCEFGIGVEYKHLNFGASFGVQNLHSNIHYLFKGSELFPTTTEHYNTSNYYPIYFMIKYGYNIFLNKK